MAGQTLNYAFSLPVVDGSEDLWGDLLNQNWSDLDALLLAREQAHRDRSTHTGTQPLSTISDAGTAASRDVVTGSTDATAGRLLRVGSFGIGGFGAGEIVDFSVWRPNGFWAGPANPPNDGPPGKSGSRGVSFNIGSATYGVEFFSDVNTTAPAAEGLLIGRRWRAGMPNSNWVMFYHEGNIVGTVSQSGGTPTGAIIERGSNANGEYVKFADGTMFCSGSGITLDGVSQGYRKTLPYAAQFTLPPSFISTSISVNAIDWSTPADRDLVGYIGDEPADRSASSFMPYVRPINGSGFTVGATTSNCSYFAIGRWY